MTTISRAFVLLLAALPRLLAAQGPVDTLRALDSAWARVYATHDTSLALALFAEDLVVMSANGNRKTKAEELADVRPYPCLEMYYFRTTDVQVRRDESRGGTRRMGVYPRGAGPHHSPEVHGGAPVGFAELSIRAYAEDCLTDRVAYLEGWYAAHRALGFAETVQIRCFRKSLATQKGAG